MAENRIGFLHPGAMGVSLAASAKNSGNTACWVSNGRSAETRRRAESQGLTEIRTLDELCETCEVIVSVCPPHAAAEVAEQVAAHSFRGVYADVNALSPDRSKLIGKGLEDAGIEYVDGGIIGNPAWKPGSTWLYLSGGRAEQVAAYFNAGPLGVEVIGTEIGKASALKMCFAANTKGTTALLCGVLAAAEALGVGEELRRQWSRNGSGYAQEVTQRAVAVTAKAWRFAGEMEEIAATFHSVNLPDGFHLASADLYRRIAGFKGADSLPQISEVVAALLKR